MQALIFSIVLVCVILSCVPARSVENTEPISKVSRKDTIGESLNYANLLKFLKNRETKLYENNDDDSSSDQSNDDDNSSDQSIDDMPRKREQLRSANRRFLIFTNQHASRRARPFYNYGRKSHWDTFFG